MCSTVDPKMEKPCDEFSASGDSLSPEIFSLSNALNKSYTISKDCCEDKRLSVLYEENSECCNDSNMIYLKSFASTTDLSECKNMCFADLDSKQISASSGFKTEICNNIEEYYDSDDSLGILPDLLDDLMYDSLNLHKDDLNKNLNTTVNISDELIGNFEDILNYDPKYSSKEFLSAVCNKINISDTQTESPVYHNQCMPKHASTPKHENSNIIDEEIALPQNIPDLYLNKILQDHNEEEKDCLNKTTIIETSPNSIITNIPTSTSLNSDENMNTEQNILNITYDMTKPINSDEISLNKTFESLPILADKYVLPSVICDSEQYKISKSNILDKTFELHYSAESDPDLGKENLLNSTCDLGKGSDTIGTVYGNCSENAKDNTRDILNTIVSYPLVHGETQLTCSLSKNKSNDDQHNFQARTGDILSSTFEKIESLKYDANSEKLKCITNLEENKLLQLGTKTVIKKRRTISFSAKSVTPEKIEFKNKGAEFDPDLGKENLLNLTCDLGKGSDTIGTVYGNCSENAKDNTRDILNTIVSYPLVHSETQLTCSLSKNKSNDDQHNFQARTGDILNSTFEKIESLKYDANSEKLKCITNLEENKLLQLGTKTVIKKRRTISFSAKSVTPEKIEFKNKGAEFDPDLGKENLLNLTCDLGKGSDTIGTVYGNCSENAKDNTRDILNTIVSYPLVHSETQLTCSLSKNKSNDDQHNFQARTGDILNSTFEKIESLKYDANSEKLKCITNLEENKLLQLGTKTVIKKRRTISFSAKSVTPEKIEFKNKGAEFDRNKNLRRSFGWFDKKNVSRPNPVKQNSRRSNASSICSVTKVPETKNLSFPKSSPKYAGNIENKSSLIHEKNEADAFKTVIKKPRKSMELSSAIESLGCYELPSRKVIKNVIPSLQKKVATKVPQMRVKEMTQEPNENKTLILSSKIGFKESLSVEEKKISRLPQRTLSQKTKFQSSCQSSSIKPSSNIATPQSITGIRPPTTGRKSIFTSTKISSNEGSELAGKVISKDIVSSQKGKEQHTETHKKFQISTKIPTISCFSRQGKTSVLSSKRTGVALCKKSQLDLR